MNWAAVWGLGGALNALEELQQASNEDIPSEVREAGLALSEALEALGLILGATPLAVDVWRAEP